MGRGRYRGRNNGEFVDDRNWKGKKSGENNEHNRWKEDIR
jgi:hypothetical protein